MGVIKGPNGKKVLIPDSKLKQYIENQMPLGPEKPYERPSPPSEPKRQGDYDDQNLTVYKRAKGKYDGKFEGTYFKL